MRKFFRKFLIYLLAFGMLCPAWLATGVLKAKAAQSAGKADTAVITDDDRVGTRPWADTSNAKESDGLYASFTSSSATSGVSHYLKATGYDFNVPAGYTIKGIEVKVERKTNSTSVKDSGVYLLKNGAIVGANYAVNSGEGFMACPDVAGNCWSNTTESTVTYGGPTDLWGTDWTVADVNNALFGVVFSAARTYGTGDRTVSVDQISMVVYYSDTEAPVITSVESDPDTTGDVTVITVKASDNIGIVKAEIDFNGAGFNNMTDNGDGTYTYLYRLSEIDPTPLPYIVRFTDAEGNEVLSEGKVVTPKDRDQPVITLTGDAEISVEKGTTYNDLGATALDNLDGDITSKIVTVNSVNTAVIGTYTVTYGVTDAAGNIANQVVRKVNVVEKALVSPDFTVTPLTGKTFKVEWTGNGSDSYKIKVNGNTDPTDPNGVVEKNATEQYSKEITVSEYGIYQITLVAVKAGIESTNNKVHSVELKAASTAPIAVSTPAPVATVGPAKAEAAAPAENKVETPADDSNGQIKGGEDKDDEAEKTNWTPWIVLFVLILLAGAATGGYFYWFNGEEEVKTVVRETKKEEVKKDNVVKTGKKSNNQKKQKRW